MTTYLDFDLEIGLGKGTEYPIAVLRSLLVRRAKC